ncbi:acyl carrier protein [Caballeronia arationis]|uniref:acyl carrier protein n=1 Tax=Caballeronia arationis TaxID=1777142 RepID=UPI00074CD312|nr:acyl carrier protein [Caballeronia arationis]SAK59508.1 acyl carrier protein [Caballeronia arationis]
MSDKQQIEERVKAIVSAQLQVPVTDIRNEDTIVAVLGADSLDEVEMLMAIEDDFGLDILDEDAESFKTVQSIIDYVKGKVPATV